jgi:PAS domain S-box-containing protein
MQHLQHVQRKLTIIAVVLYASLAGLGWAFDVQFLKGPFIHSVAPLPLGLLCLALVAMGMGLIYEEEKSLRFLGQICLSVVTIVSLLIVGQHSFGLHLPSHWLPLAIKAQFGPIGMYPIVASMFTLMAPTIWLSACKDPYAKLASQLLCLANFLVGMFYSVAYFYSLASTTEFTYMSPMPMPMPIMFLLLSFSLLVSQPEVGLIKLFSKDTIGGLVARRLIWVAILAPFIINWVRIFFEGATDSRIPYSALSACLVIGLFVAAIYWSANWLDKLDAARKWAETVREQHEEKTRLIIDQAYDAFVAIDSEGSIRDWNKQAETMFGWTREEVMGKTLAETIVPVTYRAQHSHGIRRYVATGEGALLNKRIEMPALHKSGHEFPVELAIFPVTIDGELNLCAFLQDISERKRLEQSIKMSEERFRLLVEAVKDYSIILLDPDGLIMTWNEGAKRIKGYTSEEIVGKHLRVFYTAEEQKFGKPERHLTAASIQGQFEDRGWRVRKDGSRFFANVVTTALTDESGKIIGFAKITRDLTEQKQAEDQIKQLNEALARRIIDLDKTNQQLETVNTNLSVARDQALQASDLKSKFVANMSHEIRTPISSIMGMSELLVDTHLSDEQLYFAKIIQESSQSLLRIVNDILDFSKIEAGKLELEKVEFSPQNLVQSVYELFLLQAHEKGLSLEMSCDAEVPTRVEGDPGRLKQVLVNLVSNAIKFTGKGEIKLAATVEQQHTRFVSLQFSVSDTGIGIDKQMQDRLFLPFEQADGSTTRTHGGTGLGLSISKRLIDLMGGNISLESAIGVGTTFRFSIPLRLMRPRPPKAPLYLANIETSAGERNFAPGSSQDESPNEKWILVVEDNLVLRNLALKQLERLGFPAVAVSSGSKALAEVSTGRYHLALMDCQIPDIDGFETTLAIRAREEAEKLPHLPIIAMTASAMYGDREKCINAGMDDYLSKPVRLDHLEDKLNYWLNFYQIERSEGDKPAEPSVQSKEDSQLPDKAESKSLPATGPSSETQSDATKDMAKARRENQKALDLEALGQTYGEESIKQILPSFKNEIVDLLDKLKQSFEAKDASEVARCAHQIKGLASACSAGEISRHSYAMEAAIKDHNWKKAKVEKKALEGSIAEATTFINEICTDTTV